MRLIESVMVLACLVLFCFVVRFVILNKPLYPSRYAASTMSAKAMR